ncbi:TRPM4 [Mytilus coruscus]|uniref:TRPM4 n=1 Tax=Mytilus coruscus TaxID=42192 RepID=A0A6J8B677_MYTCO|nr:TRPM4 [Mytilus coruscus]
MKKKDNENNRILKAVNNFIIDLFEDTEFKLYDVKHVEDGVEQIDLIYKDKPFHHLFVWAVLVNWREMAMIFLELETDHTCSALFASAVLNALAEKALFSKHMHLSVSLKENARHFETLACNVMTELYRTKIESALKTLVTKAGRYNSTPLKCGLAIVELNKSMEHTACQAQLNSIWSGDVAVYTPFWRSEEIERLHIVEKIAYETFQNGPSFARNRYDARNMMTDERDINKEIDSTPTQHDIKDLREEMQRMRESLIQEIRHLDYR